MADYKLLSEDDSKFDLLGPDGTPISVAKSALSPQLAAQIAQAPRQAESAQLSPLQQAYNQELQARGQGRLAVTPGMEPAEIDPVSLDAAKFLISKKEQEKAAKAAEIEKAKLNAANMKADLGFGTRPAVQNVQSVDYPSGVQVQNVAMAEQPQIAPAPDFGNLPYTTAEKMQMKAYENIGKAEAAAAEGTAKAYDDLIAKQKLADDVYNAKIVEAENRKNALHDEVLSGKVDPHKMWQNMSTGNQILAVLSVMIGGAASQFTGGRNLALEQINRAIDQDINAQEKNLDTKKSLLSEAMKEIGDINIAKDRVKQDLLTQVGAQSQMLASRAKSATATANSDLLRAQIEDQRQKRAKEVAGQYAVRTALGGGGGNAQLAYSLLPKEDKDRAIFLRDGGKEQLGLAISLDAKKQLSDIAQGKAELDSIINKYRDLAEKGIVLPGQNVKGTMDVLRSRGILAIKKVGALGNLSGGDMELAEAFFPDLTSVKRGQIANKIKATEDYAYEQMENAKKSLLQNYQPSRPTFRPTPVSFGGK